MLCVIASSITAQMIKLFPWILILKYTSNSLDYRTLFGWHQGVHPVSQLLAKGLHYESSHLFQHNILYVRICLRWVNEPHCVTSQAALSWKEVCKSEDEWFLHLLTLQDLVASSNIVVIYLIPYWLQNRREPRGKKLERFKKKKLTIWQVSGRNQRMLLALLPLAFLSGARRPSPLKFWHW